MTDKENKIVELYESGMKLNSLSKLFRMSREEIAIILQTNGAKLRSEWYVKSRYGKLDRKPKGRRHVKGFVQILVDGKWILEHRHVWIQHNGDIPQGWVVFHLNGVRDDNKIENLVATPRKDLKFDELQERIRFLEKQLKEAK